MGDPLSQQQGARPRASPLEGSRRFRGGHFHQDFPLGIVGGFAVEIAAL